MHASPRGHSARATRVGRQVLLALHLFLAVFVLAPHASVCAQASSQRPRVVVLSDIGNEPDDQMSLVRLLLYSNELDIEGLIATTSTWQKTATHPETMHMLVRTYGQVRHNLLLHAPDWPEANVLESRISSGQPVYGLAAVGSGKGSPGSQALAAAIERDDPRPLWICLWGGANTLAQALIDLRASHTAEQMKVLIARLHISSISDQDDAGPWVRREFPGIFYIVQPSAPNSEDYYYATWTGISGDVYYRNGDGADTSLITNEWLDRNIRSKGPLGKVYPRFMFIMEGDTPSFMNLIGNGLHADEQPDWGGWGGRYIYRQPLSETHLIWTQGGDLFMRSTSQDEVTGTDGKQHVSDQATIWRWREAYQNDFAARMDWTVRDYAHTNHPPHLVVNGEAGTLPLRITAGVGQTVTLDGAGSSDPDGQPLHYRWWVYPEAGLNGTHGADVRLTSPDSQRTELTVSAACRAAWLPLVPCTTGGVAHIILEVSDDGSPSLRSYRRIILEANAASPVH